MTFKALSAHRHVVKDALRESAVEGVRTVQGRHDTAAGAQERMKAAAPEARIEFGRSKSAMVTADDLPAAAPNLYERIESLWVRRLGNTGQKKSSSTSRSAACSTSSGSLLRRSTGRRSSSQPLPAVNQRASPHPVTSCPRISSTRPMTGRG